MDRSILELVNSQRNNAQQSNQLQQPQPQSPLTNESLQQIKNVMRYVQNSKNPAEAMQQILMQNPNCKNIAQLLQLKNGNLQQVAQFLADQQGIDLNNLIQQLKS